MQRFPYIIFYEEFDANVWIYVFAHSKRRPGYWVNRVEEKKLTISNGVK
jgi:outer membrane protein assembly factor BamE (lipoprotein component of BamABCDE complex)